MVRLHELSLGDVFEDLLVEVWQLEGVDPASKPRDPVYSAIVRDPSGYCRLIYRANNSCKPSNVKRGKFYRISGKVSSYKGRMQIQIGSSWGRVEKVNGDEFVCNLPYSPATDLSAMERWYGALVVHAASGEGGESHRLRAYVLPLTRYQQSQQPQAGAAARSGGGGGGGGGGAAAGLLPMPPSPVPCTTAAYVETERGAAHRALRDVLRVAPDAVRILPLPPVLHIQAGAAGGGGAGGAPSFWHIFPAVLQSSDADLKFVFGEPRGGAWVDLDELTATDGPVAPPWRPPLTQLVALLRTAHAAGLVDLHLPPPEAAPAVAAAAESSSLAAAAAAAAAAAESSSLAAAAEPLTPQDTGREKEEQEPQRQEQAKEEMEKQIQKEHEQQQPQQQEQEQEKEQEQRKLPVTLISGFLGAGKTTLLRHILTNREANMRCAVVVNDMAELNIDAALVAHGSLSAAAATSSLGGGGGGGGDGGGGAAVVAAAPERLVELHNGCICCTLRGDLVQQVAEIAADGRFDYCVVESTGIGEPMQVAETFEFPLDGSDPAAALALEAAAAAMRAAGGGGGGGGGADPARAAAAATSPGRLADVARLDTCVTVVDASNLLDNLHSLETLKDREPHERVHVHGGGRRKGPEAGTAAAAEAAAASAAGGQPRTQSQPCEEPDCSDDHDHEHDHEHEHEHEHEPRPGQEEEDEELERNVADLLLDQLEFADVILLNKVDTVPPEQLPRLMALVAAINPSARVLPTTQANVALPEVLNTGRFSLERAREGAGWLKAIREGTDLVPETAEYGITSFVWRSRRPFHPARLHVFMNTYFVLQQPDWSLADGGEGAVVAGTAAAATAHVVEEPPEEGVAGAIVVATRPPPAAAASASIGAGDSAAAAAAAAAAGLGVDLAAAARAQAAAAAALAGVFAGGAFNPGGAAAGGFPFAANGGFPFGAAFPFAPGGAAGAAAGAGLAGAAAGGVPQFGAAGGFPFGAPGGGGGFSLDAALQAAASATMAAANAAAAAATAAAAAAAAAAANLAPPGNAAPAPNQDTRPQTPAQPSPPPPAAPPHVPRASAGGFPPGGPSSDLTGGVAAVKGAARTAAYGQVLRSKGFAWVAGRDDHVGEWSSAGNLMRFGTGGPWYDVLPREAWPSEADKVADIEKDFLPGIGDRRQELVFIGIDMKRDQLVAALEVCLATPEEEEQLKKAAAAVPNALDPFLPWPDIQDIMDAGDDEDEEEEEEEEAEEEEVEEDGEEGGEEDEEEGGPVGRWEPGQVLDDISDGAAELQRLLDDTEQPALVVLWHAPWAAASREAEAGLVALASKHPDLVFVRLDVTASQANEALAVSGSRLLALPTSRRSDARPTLRDGSKWPALTLHRPPGLRHEAYFAGPTALAELRSELARRQSEWSDASVNSGAADARIAATADSCSSTPATAPRRRRRAESVPATPAKPTAAAAAPPAPASISSSSGQQQNRISELRRGAADLKSHLQEARDAGCPLVVAWLAAPPPAYPSTPTVSVPSAVSAAATSSSMATPPPPARRGAAQPLPPSALSSSSAAATPKHDFYLLELSEQDQAALRVDVAAACGQYGAAVRVLFADPGASSANRALAEALRVAAAPTLQLYTDMKMVKALKGAGAVGKLAATLADVAPPPAAAAAAISQPHSQPQPQTGGVQQLLSPTSGSGSESASAPGASTDCLPSAPAASSGLTEQQHTPTVYDPPTGKYGKPGVYKQFGPRGRGVFWPRMPCLRCGCPWWLGEDWDAECVRCGWDCEADGYDDDSNPLPAFKAKYDAFTAALREGRTPAWRGKHVGPRG